MGESPVRHFLIASHGHLAGGVRSALDIIIGQRDNVFILEAYINENKGIEEGLQEILNQIPSSDELIIFTDLLGGSITNQIVRFTTGRNVHIVSGFNLALIIEIIMGDIDQPASELIDAAILSARGQIVYVNSLMSDTTDSEL